MAPLQPKPAHLGLILPLCTSSATLGLALFQYPLWLSFLHAPASESLAGKPLSAFWKTYSVYGVPSNIGTALATVLSGFICARWLHTHQTLETVDVGRWYTYGAALTLLKLASVFIDAPVVKRISEAGDVETKSEGEIEERNRRDMGRWLAWHGLRTALLDVPALWFFAEGAALSFWVI